MTTVDVSDAWSEEDLHDLMRASLAHAEHTIWAGERDIPENAFYQPGRLPSEMLRPYPSKGGQR